MPFCMRIFEPPINDISSNKNNYNIYIYTFHYFVQCPMCMYSCILKHYTLL